MNDSDNDEPKSRYFLDNEDFNYYVGPTIMDVVEAIQSELNNTDFNDNTAITFIVTCKMMTDEELSKLPEI